MPEIFVAPKKTEKRETKKELVEKKPTVGDGPFNQLRTAFSAFAVKPVDIHFENQEDGEEVLLLLRRHWATNLSWLILAVVFILGPTIVFPAFSFLKILSFIPLKFQTVAFFIWSVFIFTFIFTNFISWYFNVYIVTNRRIIDVDFFNLLYKEVSSCYISKIQDITYKVGGALRLFFDYGTVYIQTAGEEKNLEFEYIPKPAAVVRKIMELMEKTKETEL